MASLAPTYRLMWGLAGESNALVVARGLGFDPLVVDEAERLVRESPFSLRNASMVSALT
jgi:DNA mismatch repair protein MutS2